MRSAVFIGSQAFFDMFHSESTLNQYFIGYLETLTAEVSADNFNTNAFEGGHPPVWILGHLAICGELGIKLLGGELGHPKWLVLFGPGSTGVVSKPGKFSTAEFLEVIKASYPKIIQMATNADAETLNAPHGIELLNDTGIKTLSDLISHLLTTHFAFHTAQLSTWRRAAGHAQLF